MKTQLVTSITESEPQTIALGEQFAKTLAPGAVLLLFGELGIGKTAFVRGLAKGLKLDSDTVSSPTFTLINEYQGRPTFYHVDLYRVDPSEVDDLGLIELGDSQEIIAIEWADHLPRPWRGAIQIEFRDVGGDRREIKIKN